jgi:hypothetical protein
VEHRTTHDLTLTGNYTFSKLIEKDTRLNDEDNFLNKRVSPFDHTHHFTVGGTYDLPFGQGKMFNFGGNRLADELLGGFVINSIYQFESGPPVYFSSDIPFIPGQGPANIKVQTRNTSVIPTGKLGPDGTPALVNAWQIFATGSQSGYVPKTTTCLLSACDGTVSSYNPNAQPQAGTTQTQADAIALSTDATFNAHYRTLPTTFGNVRQDGYNNLDASILKNFPIQGESRFFQLRFETFNTLNHPIFSAPNITTGSNFGYITAVTSNSQSRQVQLGGRLVF